MSTCDLCEAEEIDCDRMVPELLRLRARVAELEEAIRAHREAITSRKGQLGPSDDALWAQVLEVEP